MLFPFIIGVGVFLCCLGLFIWRFRLVNLFWGKKNARAAEQSGFDPIKMSKFVAIVLLGSGALWILTGIASIFFTIPVGIFIYVLLGPSAVWTLLCLLYVAKIKPEALYKQDE